MPDAISVVPTSADLLARQYAGADAWNLKRVHEAWGRAVDEHVTQPRRYGHSRLRIGVLSTDFRHHAMAGYLHALLLGLNDHADVVCYHDHGSSDPVTVRLKRLAKGWRNVHGMPDEEVAAQMVRDEVDVLVDTCGHMPGNRMLMLARYPTAPVRVHWAGYPGTVGLPSLSGVITDRILTPDPDEFVEPAIYLDHALCWAPPAGPRPEGLSLHDEPTFAVLVRANRPWRIAAPFWRFVLQEIGAKLMVFAENTQIGLDFSAQIKLPSTRITFVPGLPQAIYHRTLMRCWGLLDNFAYSGGATACEALWLGVPVITLGGRSNYAARQASAVIGAAGIDGVVSDGWEYAKAADKIADGLDLGGGRQGRQVAVECSRLMDHQRFGARFYDAVSAL